MFSFNLNMDKTFFSGVKGKHINIANPTIASLEEVSALGFGLVRLPYTGRIDVDIVRHAVKLGLKVVVDYHPSLDWWKDSANIFLLPYICELAEKALAEFSCDDVAIEIINEPRMGKRLPIYNSLLDLCIKAIRELNPNRWIVVSNQQLNDIDFFSGPLGKFTAPDYKRIIVSLHYYRPFDLTHPLAYLKGTSVEVDIPLSFPPTSGFAKADFANLDLHISRFLNWCKINGVVPWIGEFGCHEFVPNRLGWYRAVLSTFDKYGVPSCLWSWQDEFGLRKYARTNQPQQKDYEDLLALILA